MDDPPGESGVTSDPAPAVGWEDLDDLFPTRRQAPEPPKLVKQVAEKKDVRKFGGRGLLIGAYGLGYAFAFAFRLSVVAWPNPDSPLAIFQITFLVLGNSLFAGILAVPALLATFPVLFLLYLLFHSFAENARLPDSLTQDSDVPEPAPPPMNSTAVQGADPPPPPLLTDSLPDNGSITL